MRSIRILLATSEASPFAKVGGLADVAGSLPGALNQCDCDARVVLPLYRKIKQEYIGEMTFLGWKMVKMGWRSLYGGLFTMFQNGVQYYFVDNEYYFNHDQIYVEYSFDIERYCFFQRAVLDFMGGFMDFEPDVLHCNDWQTGMMPLLLDVHYKANHIHDNVQTVFTIHNLKYQGVHGIEMIKDLLDLPDRFVTEEFCVKDSAINCMKAGIVFANTVTTVSPTYAYEIMTDYFGEGLNGLLRKYAYKVKGILNGINQEEFNPSADGRLVQTYDVSSYKDGKAANKKKIQESLGLSVNPDAPLCVMIGRLVDQKGLDLLLHVIEEMLFDGMQFVVLGLGDLFYESALSVVAERNREKMCAYLEYSNETAHLLYAAADIFLMPSLFEPCGLSQMISMKYGTIPVVRETGGLKDTVLPYNEIEDTGTGFCFANINAHEFLFITKYACNTYRNHRDAWYRMIERAMAGDYSWEKSACEYAGLYSLITGISDEAVEAAEADVKPVKKVAAKSASKSVEKKSAAKSAKKESAEMAVAKSAEKPVAVKKTAASEAGAKSAEGTAAARKTPPAKKAVVTKTGKKPTAPKKTPDVAKSTRASNKKADKNAAE